MWPPVFGSLCLLNKRELMTRRYLRLILPEIKPESVDKHEKASDCYSPSRAPTHGRTCTPRKDPTHGKTPCPGRTLVPQRTQEALHVPSRPRAQSPGQGRPTHHAVLVCNAVDSCQPPGLLKGPSTEVATRGEDGREVSFWGGLRGGGQGMAHRSGGCAHTLTPTPRLQAGTWWPHP